MKISVQIRSEGPFIVCETNMGAAMFKVGDHVKWVVDVKLSENLDPNRIYKIVHINEAQDLVLKGLEGLGFASSRFVLA